MVFNDTTDKSGIIQSCETFLGMTDGSISGNATLLKIFTRLVNSRYRQVVALIWDNQDGWQFDDGNLTDLPVATADLVASQQDYELPSTAQRVERIEVMDSAGNYQLVNPIDKAQINESSMPEYFETAGLPLYYDLVGRSIMLYPKPSSGQCTLTAGLQVYFGRDIHEFVSTDTTAIEPGFANNFHEILPLGASLDYAIGNTMTDKISILVGLINNMEEKIIKFFTKRHPDFKTRIRPTTSSSI